MESYTFGDLGSLEAQVNGVEAEEVTEEVEDMPEAIYGAEDYGAEDFDDQYEEEGVDQIYGVSEYDAQDAENQLLEQFNDLDEAEIVASQAFGAAARSFQEARELVNQVKQARGYFPKREATSPDSGILRTVQWDLPKVYF